MCGVWSSRGVLPIHVGCPPKQPLGRADTLVTTQNQGFTGPPGLRLLLRTLPALGPPSISGSPAPGEQPALALLACDPEDLQGRSTHKLGENSAVEVLCEALVLLGRALLHLQLSLVWGRHQERLKGRERWGLASRHCPAPAHHLHLHPRSQRHATLTCGFGAPAAWGLPFVCVQSIYGEHEGWDGKGDLSFAALPATEGTGDGNTKGTDPVSRRWQL